MAIVLFAAVYSLDYTGSGSGSVHCSLCKHAALSRVADKALAKAQHQHSIAQSQHLCCTAAYVHFHQSTLLCIWGMPCQLGGVI